LGSGIALKYLDEYRITSDWCASMIMCVCGDVFNASGARDDVRQKEGAWTKAHRDCKPQKREGRKVFWLSFCDGERPKGQQFLGACIVDVTAVEADEAAIDVMLMFPHAQPNSEWIAAASRKAHRLGCNPGGEMASMEIDPDHPNLARYEFGVLMDRATIERIDADILDAD